MTLEQRKEFTKILKCLFEKCEPYFNTNENEKQIEDVISLVMLLSKGFKFVMANFKSEIQDF